MAARDIADVASLLYSISWLWTMRAWSERSGELGLMLIESRGQRRTYSDPQGRIWDVYLDGEAIVSVEVEDSLREDVASLSDGQYEDLVDEFYRYFVELCSCLTKTIGPPKFADGAAADGFPSDQDAVWLALWPAKNARLMLQVKHEARDAPMRICLVVAPAS